MQKLTARVGSERETGGRWVRVCVEVGGGGQSEPIQMEVGGRGRWG